MNIKQAFTLIELLVAIAIIGILSGLIVVSMSGVTAKANVAKGQVFSNSLRNSLLLDLTSEWDFDQVNVPGANQTPDSWSGGNIGTLNGAGGTQNLPQLKTTGCVSGNCLQFDGGDDNIDFGSGSNLNIQGAMTISFWVNPLTFNFVDVAAHIFGNGVSNTYGYNIWLYKTGYVQYRTNQNAVQQNTSSNTGYIPQNSWTHIAITRSGANAYTYINGIDRTNSHGTHIDPTISGVNVFTSRYPSSVTYVLNGYLDEIRFYDAVMSISQIKEQYYLGLNNLLTNGSISQSEYIERINGTAQR